MTIPTKGETFAKLTEHIRRAQEESATLAHLANADDDRRLAQGWLTVSELFRRMLHEVTELATRGLQ